MAVPSPHGLPSPSGAAGLFDVNVSNHFALSDSDGTHFGLGVDAGTGIPGSVSGFRVGSEIVILILRGCGRRPDRIESRPVSWNQGSRQDPGGQSVHVSRWGGGAYPFDRGWPATGRSG